MTHMTSNASGKTKHLPLTNGQIIQLVIWGAVLWFTAAMLLRLLGPMGIYEGINQVILYALVVPGTLPFIVAVQRLTKTPREHAGLGIAVATTAAVLLDGIALAWFPFLYGTETHLIAGAGAVILWGAGVGMFYGFWLNRAE